jgi:hypothetical protein
VSNQDHSFMQGVELADRLTGTGAEDTLLRPSLVNGGAYREPGVTLPQSITPARSSGGRAP